MKFAASDAVAPFQGPATETKTTFCLPYCAYKLSKTGAMCWQWGHQGSINSRSTTLPLKDASVSDWPVKPDGQLEVDEQTTGRGTLRSGANPDWEIVVLTLFVRELELVGDCVKEYTDHIATMMIIGMAMISHLLSP